MSRTINTYLYDRATGKPLAHVNGEAFNTADGTSAGTGTSDDNGLLSISVADGLRCQTVAYVPGDIRVYDERDTVQRIGIASGGFVSPAGNQTLGTAWADFIAATATVPAGTAEMYSSITLAADAFTSANIAYARLNVNGTAYTQGQFTMQALADSSCMGLVWAGVIPAGNTTFKVQVSKNNANNTLTAYNTARMRWKVYV